jgi:hypothetical protein
MGSMLDMLKRSVRDCEKSEISEITPPLPAQRSSIVGEISELSEISRRPVPAQDIADDVRGAYDERAAIVEFDGQRPRAQAELMAWNEVAAAWYRDHGQHIQPALCAGCEQPLSGASNVLDLPNGERVHADREYTCVVAYGQRWTAAAATALAVMGIPTLVEINDEAQPVAVAGPSAEQGEDWEQEL